jgi:UDP-N-acetylmuramate--alanine ligase
LREGDAFIFLPVFYAGGSSSFTPTSAEVAEEYRRLGKRDYRYAGSRTEAAAALAEAGPDDAILILGARDNSLALWAEELASGR